MSIASAIGVAIGYAIGVSAVRFAFEWWDEHQERKDLQRKENANQWPTY